MVNLTRWIEKKKEKVNERFRYKERRKKRENMKVAWSGGRRNRKRPYPPSRPCRPSTFAPEPLTTLP